MASAGSIRTLLRSLPQHAGRAIDWWLNELRDILELLLGFGKRKKVEFEISADGEPVPITNTGRAAARSGNLLLRLAESDFMYRRIKLPSAARRNIRQVVGYEFNRYFPMNSENACYSCRVATTDPAATSIEVEIWAIGKSRIDRYLSSIGERYRIRIRQLEIANEEGHVLILRDIAREASLEDAGRAGMQKRLLDFAIAGLVAIVLFYPVKRLDDWLALQQAELDRLENEAGPIIELRERSMSLNRRFGELLERVRQSPNQIGIWSQITELMAEQAELDTLEISGRNVRVVGRTRSVEALVGRLESNEKFAEVKINAPVKKAAGENHETLDLSLKVSE